MNTNEFVQKVQMAILAVFSVLVMSSAGWAATYYVDATNGIDSNNGLTTSTAWKTIAKVNNSTFIPGDFILFKREEIWREQLTIPSIGIPDNPITFGGYGSGHNPVINAANVISNWMLINVYDIEKYGLDATINKHIYKAPLTIEPHIVSMNGVVLKKCSNIPAISDHEWFWDNNVLYVYSTLDPDTAFVDPGIEASVRNFCINGGSSDYITIDGLTLKHANAAGLYASQIDDWTVQNCTIEDNYMKGLYARAGTGDSLTGWIIQDNTFETVHAPEVKGSYAAVYMAGTSGAIVRRNIIQAGNGKGIILNSGNEYGAGAKSENAVLHSNDISGSEGGILLWDSDGSSVYYNRVHDGYGSGISIQRTDNTEVYYNLIYNLDYTVLGGPGAGYNGIDINHDSDSNKIYNNTVYKVYFASVTVEDCGDGSCPSDGNEIKNNIFDASQNYEMSSQTTCIFIRSACTNTVFSNNLYQNGGTSSLSVGYVGPSTQYDKYEWDTWVSGHRTTDTNSSEGNPLFMDAANSNCNLQPNSPCIDAGKDVALTQDISGTFVPQSVTVDIGALEYKKVEPPKYFRIVR